MDLAVLQWIQIHLASPALDAVMPVVTTLGDQGAIWLVIAVGLLIMKHYRRYGIELIGSVALAGFLANLVIKPLVHRLRPFEIDPSVTLLIPPPITSSFPSGHTAASVAAAVAICFMPIKWYWKMGALFVAVSISFSRMYLYVHFPTDVAAGAVLGVACGVLIGYTGKYVAARRRRKRDTSVAE